MESGLEGRNNLVTDRCMWVCPMRVSMESGLEGRNNLLPLKILVPILQNVSMESGLEGRNNLGVASLVGGWRRCLNGVRPRRPEQWVFFGHEAWSAQDVSMESGLEGRNNRWDWASGGTGRLSQWSPA